MSRKKKKLSLKFKIWNIALIVLLAFLVLFLLYFLTNLLFSGSKFYKVENRNDNILKSRKSDEESYETIGWLRAQGTNIDYPVYGILNDNTFGFPVTESYLWSLNMDSDFHNVLILYGHNIMNLGPNPRRHDDNFTRLEELMSFVYYDFAQDNKYIQFTMDGENHLYEIFAVNFMRSYDLDEYPEGEFNEVDKKNYVDRLKKESIYDYDIEVKDSDNVISVVTCSRFFEDGKSYDFIVTGREIQKKESIKNYNVYRNKNYEKVDEKLKGDDEDEKSEDM